MRQVGDQSAVVGEDLGADGDVHLRGLAVRTVLAGTAAVCAARRLDQATALQRREVAQRGIREQHDVAAVAAVATVRAALGHELLAAEAETAVSALAGLDVDLGAVAEHRTHEPGSQSEPGSVTKRQAWVSSTDTERRSPLRWNVITPGRIAKIVSSRPICVPGPGRNLVPRWRTMMLPGSTVWPENIFTPRYFGFESRPFLEEPRPFLCAISCRPPSPSGPTRLRRSRPCAPREPARTRALPRASAGSRSWRRRSPAPRSCPRSRSACP